MPIEQSLPILPSVQLLTTTNLIHLFGFTYSGHFVETEL